MKTVKLQIELTYDDVLLHGEGDKEAEEWFFREVLGNECVLHSNEIGDEIGTVKVIQGEDENGDVLYWS